MQKLRSHQPFMLEYLAVVKEKIKLLETFEAINACPKGTKQEIDVLGMLANTRTNGVTHSFIQKTLEKQVLNPEKIVVYAMTPLKYTSF
jgi:transposase-like protein